MAAKHWTLRTCIEKFTSLCEQAFTPRELHEVYGVRKLVTLRHGSRFNTTPLHQALKSAFGEQYMFGGEQESDTAYMTKVAVTSTTGTGQSPLVISNYGRQDDSQLTYNIEFSLGTDLGLKVWEAAAATSAAPSFFKPFKHPRADRSYMDGALYHNNPIKIANNERRLLWPDVADSHPDVMLSIGTGQNLLETKISLKKGMKSQSEIEKEKNAKSYGKTDVKGGESQRKKLFRTAENVKNFFSVLVRSAILIPATQQIFGRKLIFVQVNRMDNVLDSELAWRDFATDVGGSDEASTVSQRYIRVNPDLQRVVPRLDAKEQLKDLQQWTISFMETPSMRKTILNVSHRLVASSFYFDKSGVKEAHSSEGYVCSGMTGYLFQRLDADEDR